MVKHLVPSKCSMYEDIPDMYHERIRTRLFAKHACACMLCRIMPNYTREAASALQIVDDGKLAKLPQITARRRRASIPPARIMHLHKQQQILISPHPTPGTHQPTHPPPKQPTHPPTHTKSASLDDVHETAEHQHLSMATVTGVVAQPGAAAWNLHAKAELEVHTVAAFMSFNNVWASEVKEVNPGHKCLYKPIYKAPLSDEKVQISADQRITSPAPTYRSKEITDIMLKLTIEYSSCKVASKRNMGP